jgi:hypothetical protein
VRNGSHIVRRITLLDVTGKILAEVKPLGTETVVSLEARTPGLYMLRIYDEAGRSAVFPVSVVR